MELTVCFRSRQRHQGISEGTYNTVIPHQLLSHERGQGHAARRGHAQNRGQGRKPHRPGSRGEKFAFRWSRFVRQPRPIVNRSLRVADDAQPRTLGSARTGSSSHDNSNSSNDDGGDYDDNLSSDIEEELRDDQPEVEMASPLTS